MAKKKQTIGGLKLAFVPVPLTVEVEAVLTWEAVREDERGFVLLPLAVYGAAAGVDAKTAAQHAHQVVAARVKQLRDPLVNVAPATRLLTLAASLSNDVGADAELAAQVNEAARFAGAILRDPTNIPAKPLFATAAETVTFWQTVSLMEPMDEVGAATFNRAFAALLDELGYPYALPCPVQEVIDKATAADDLRDLLFAACLRQAVARAAVPTSTPQEAGA